MESLSDTTWDVLISGTGLAQSLLALALSRSGKKILHIDKNDYYGGAEAAFSLQEAEDWVKRVGDEISNSTTFTNASIYSKPESQASGTQLSFSRAYSLSLSPQLIYTQSALIPFLVSSRVYRQLEFQAVGTWWMCRSVTADSEDASESEISEPPRKRRKATLQRVPNGREDLIPDTSLPFKAKMALVKFLNAVAKPDEAPEVEPEDSEAPLSEYLERRFRLPGGLHEAVHGVSLSPSSVRRTQTKYALPRIRRHLRSIGVFGPGFGSVIPKWGGTAEIAQVACRAGAVGGGVYVLGREIKSFSRPGQPHSSEVSPESEAKDDCFEVELSDGEKIRTKLIAGSPEDLPNAPSTSDQKPPTESTRSITIVSSALDNLFPTIAEGGPSPAGAVVVVPGDLNSPSSSTENEDEDVPPVYLFIHSADTGECPAGQSVIYASTSLPAPAGHERLEHAVEALLDGENTENLASVLWSMRYTQRGLDSSHTTSREQSTPQSSEGGILICPPPSLDLAFDDEFIESVKGMWRAILGSEAVEEAFLRFEDREGMGGGGGEEGSDNE